MVSLRTSLSHFCPLCRENAHRSEANQADTAARPKDVNAVRTVVSVEVTCACAKDFSYQRGDGILALAFTHLAGSVAKHAQPN